MSVALVGAASFNAQHFLSQSFDCVVAVDAGWQACRDNGIVPSVALGDFDSLGFVPADGKVASYPSVKDESDMELAFRYVLEHGARDVYVYGALSERLDHSLANLQVMSAFAKQGLRIIGIGSDMAVACLAKGDKVAEGAPYALEFGALNPASLTGDYAPYLSNFALCGAVQDVSITGLKYELDHAVLPPEQSLGLSNQFIGGAARIQVEQGCLVSMFPLDALSYATLIS